MILHRVVSRSRNTCVCFSFFRHFESDRVLVHRRILSQHNGTSADLAPTFNLCSTAPSLHGFLFCPCCCALRRLHKPRPGCDVRAGWILHKSDPTSLLFFFLFFLPRTKGPSPSAQARRHRLRQAQRCARFQQGERNKKINNKRRSKHGKGLLLWRAVGPPLFFVK